jgi:hypothetical protein
MSGAGNRTKRKTFLLDKERLGPNDWHLANRNPGTTKGRVKWNEPVTPGGKGQRGADSNYKHAASSGNASGLYSRGGPFESRSRGTCHPEWGSSWFSEFLQADVWTEPPNRPRPNDSIVNKLQTNWTLVVVILSVTPSGSSLWERGTCVIITDSLGLCADMCSRQR